MAYKVFFVEDELVTRQGVRDNVDWAGHGFEFSGEASDGEMALPLLRAAQPDVLITDIKMPFMDGLQLTKIVRERMPWVKVVILSGHDEFEYAQKAIDLGVTEYLLKPVTVQKMHQVLVKLAAQLDTERQEQENLKKLQEQLAGNQALLRERLLFKLVMGVVAPNEAIEQGQLLGLDLIARCYLAAIVKIELNDRSEQFDFDEYQRLQQIIAGLVENDPDVFMLNKDWQETVLVMKGNSPDILVEERDLLLSQIEQAILPTRYRLTIGAGSPKKRTSDLYQSFVEALVSIQSRADPQGGAAGQSLDSAELLKVDKTAIENYLRCGVQEGFDEFFNTSIRPAAEAALKSHLVKDYLFMDLALAAARLVADLGGDIVEVIPELGSIESILDRIQTAEQLRQQAQKILLRTLDFRDHHSGSAYTAMIHKARTYIECNYKDAELSLNDVSTHVNLSASHFSLVFSQETGQTFKEYLTELRIQKAKELLRSTPERATDIAYQVGYNDPHYFSAAFKKKTGLSPTEYRQKAS